MDHRIQPALSFDDVLIQPRYSEIIPLDANLSVHLTKNIHMKIPIMSSAMDTVTESRLAITLGKEGGIGVIHKNMTIEEQVQELVAVKLAGYTTAAAIGVGSSGLLRANKLIENGLNLLVVDTAHGHSKGVLETIREISRKYPEIDIMAGNVVTPEAVSALVNAGANLVKIGIGPGSICTTRIVSGVGLPQMSALIETSEEAHRLGIKIVGDGGIRNSGDLAKCLARADCAMIGGLFAATMEAPGDIIEIDDKKFKYYRGMGSLAAMRAGSDRYGLNVKLVAEGVESRVPYKGDLSGVLSDLLGGLRSSMGYTGSSDLQTFQKNAVFRQITSGGLRESHVHDVYTI